MRSVQVVIDLALIPGVIAKSEHINSSGEQLVCRVRGDAQAPRGVLAVGDDDLQLKLFAQPGYELLHQSPPRSTRDIPYEEQPHDQSPSCRRGVPIYSGGRAALAFWHGAVVSGAA